MSPPPPVIDRHGRPVQLDKLLGEGGEGAVFTVSSDASRVAKIYKPGKLPPPEKLGALVGLANPQLLTVAAWPMGLLFHSSTRHVAGVLMPRLSDCQPIQHLYNPVQRLKFFPRAGWTFQIRAARNLAAAFDEVHRAGCVVGDVNQGNAMVSTQALVRLIDCDSFQVRVNGKHWLCDVGVAHYTPPELQGKPLHGVVRTENHDRFGLAVLLYQLLFVGRHPYMGIYRGRGDPSFDELIREFRFAQGPMARSWGMDPPPYTPVFSDIPPNLGILFRRAFERGSESGSRPSPVEWFDAFKNLEQNISECPVDPGHKFWRGSGNCTWCRLAGNGGPEYFFGVAGVAGSFVVNSGRLQEVIKRLAACALFDFPTERKSFLPARPPAPRPLPEGVANPRDQGIFQAIAAWVADLFSQSPWHEELRKRKQAYDRAVDPLKEMEATWRSRIQGYRNAHEGKRRLVERSISDCKHLDSMYATEMQQLTSRAEAAAFLRHMRLYLIAEADIPNIGNERRRILAEYGILTAADVDENRVQRIKGFGQVLTACLMGWKRDVQYEFEFDPKSAVSPGDQRALTVKFRSLEQQVHVELGRRLHELEQLAPACRKSLEAMYPELQQCLAAWCQARADLRLMKYAE
jgi:DNA-binding helix-hairpin-helix protein with protein kinase domain